MCFTTQAKEKYEKALDELSKCTPQYMENMEQVFDQCQQFEEKRLSFLREVLLDVKRHLNLTEDQRFEAFKKVNMTRNSHYLIISHTLNPCCLFTAMLQCTENLNTPSHQPVHRKI